MFDGWDNFYIIIGSTSGALVGVMFVVATLTAGLEEGHATRGAQIYITPIVFHFTVVVVISALSAVPGLTPEAVGVVLVVCAAAGLIYATVTMFRVFLVKVRDAAPDRSDKIWYGILPVAAYLLLTGAAAAIWLAPKIAAHAIGAAAFLLLLIGIRDAWDLATFLVTMAKDQNR
jgi:hypothetical protein